MNNFSTGDSTNPSQGKGLGGLVTALQNNASTPSGKGQSQDQNQGLNSIGSVAPQQSFTQPTQLDGGSGNVTYPGQSGQPQMGQPNSYSNTIGQQTSQMSPMAMSGQGGKGKGA